MANLSELRQRVSAKISIEGNSAGIDQTLLDSWINEGVVDVVLRTRCAVSSSALSVTAADQALSSSVLAILDAYTTSNNQTYKLERVGVQELLDLRAGANPQQGPPIRRYALAGANLLMVWPWASTQTVTIYYVPRPAALSATGDSPTDIPAEFHKAVELYALAEAADYDDDQSSGQGDRYRGLYEQWIVKANRSIKKKGHSRLGRAVLGRRVVVPNDNSTDTPWNW